MRGALSPDESSAALLGAERLEVVSVREPYGVARHPKHDVRLPGVELPKEFGSGSYMGVAWSPDGRRIYFGAANEGQIKTIDVTTGEIVATIHINDDAHKDSRASRPTIAAPPG